MKRVSKLQAAIEASYRDPGYLESLAAADTQEDPVRFVLSDADYARIAESYRPTHRPSRLAQALGRWISKGMPVAKLEELERRQAICGECPEREARSWGWNCRVCGCCSLKHLMATESCPLGRW